VVLAVLRVLRLGLKSGFSKKNGLKQKEGKMENLKFKETNNPCKVEEDERRSEMFKKKAALIGLSAFLLVALTVFGVCAKERTVAIGTSSVGSTTYVMGVGMADLISKHTSIGASAQATGGTSATIRAINAGKVDIGVGNAFGARQAYLGVGKFSKDGKIPIRLLMHGHPSFRPLIARADSGINSVSDLIGKRIVAKRRALPGLELQARALLKVHGVPADKVKFVETRNTGQAIDALITGSVQAIIVPGGAPNPNVTRLTRSKDVRFVQIDEKKLDMVIKALGKSFYKLYIPAGTYKGQDKAVPSVVVRVVLVAHRNLPESVVYEIMKTLMGYQGDLKLLHSVGKWYSQENALIKPAIPFHPGAVKYFKEKGVWSAELEETQKQFLKELEG
jgi:hypothetical protein